jgi:hypothetical protein
MAALLIDGNFTNLFVWAGLKPPSSRSYATTSGPGEFVFLTVTWEDIVASSYFLMVFFFFFEIVSQELFARGPHHLCFYSFKNLKPSLAYGPYKNIPHMPGVAADTCNPSSAQAEAGGK